MELVRTWTGRSERSRHSLEKPRRSLDLEKPFKESWAGHYNRLDESQQTTLAKFKTVLQEQNLYTPDPPNYDEPSLIRYLRARRWDVNGAVAQFRESARARRENRIDELYENIDVDFYEKARVLYPQFTGHRDRRGLPLYVYQIKHLDSKTVSVYTKDAVAWKNEIGWGDAPAPVKLLPLYALYQNLLTLVLPLCSTLPRPDVDVPVTQCTNIVDVSGVGIKTFWNLKAHMQEASTIANMHFPETLDRIFIIGAPYFFPTVWGWIKRWFDPNTVSKIYILGKDDMTPTLEKFFEPSSIPKVYGGELDWEYGQLPSMDEEVRKRVGHDWMRGPARWEGQYVPLGTVNGKQRERPAPIPEDKRPPLVQNPPAGAIATPTAPILDDKPEAAEAIWVNGEKGVDSATVSIADPQVTEDRNAADHSSVENPVLADTARTAILDVAADSSPQVNGVEESPSTQTETAATTIRSEEKHEGEANGMAKLGLGLAETPAEILLNGSA